MKNCDISNGTVIISRTDSIGDVVLTLPMCAALKKKFPNVKIVFLASSYTIPVVRQCAAVDEILDATELLGSSEEIQLEKLKAIQADAFVHVFPNKKLANLAKKAKIPHRIGTSHRMFHFLTCNHRIDFTRKNSDFHEAQLNFHLLKPFGFSLLPSFDELNEDVSYFQASAFEIPQDLKSQKKKIILHAKSQGSAVEWPIEKYLDLAKRLVEMNFMVYFTGTEKEGIEIRKEIKFGENCIDTTGRFTLQELISFIQQCDSLVACSTGPLHIAGLLNQHCIGLFTPKRPMHPGRWKPLGSNSSTLTAKPNCTCATKSNCTCLAAITVDQVLDLILASSKA